MLKVGKCPIGFSRTNPVHFAGDFNTFFWCETKTWDSVQLDLSIDDSDLDNVRIILTDKSNPSNKSDFLIDSTKNPYLLKKAQYNFVKSNSIVTSNIYASSNTKHSEGYDLPCKLVFAQVFLNEEGKYQVSLNYWYSDDLGDRLPVESDYICKIPPSVRIVVADKKSFTIQDGLLHVHPKEVIHNTKIQFNSDLILGINKMTTTNSYLT